MRQEHECQAAPKRLRGDRRYPSDWSQAQVIRGNRAMVFTIKTSPKSTLHLATGDAVAYNGNTG